MVQRKRLPWLLRVHQTPQPPIFHFSLLSQIATPSHNSRYKLQCFKNSSSYTDTEKPTGRCPSCPTNISTLCFSSLIKSHSAASRKLISATILTLSSGHPHPLLHIWTELPSWSSCSSLSLSDHVARGCCRVNITGSGIIYQYRRGAQVPWQRLGLTGPRTVQTVRNSACLQSLKSKHIVQAKVELPFPFDRWEGVSPPSHHPLTFHPALMIRFCSMGLSCKNPHLLWQGEIPHFLGIPLDTPGSFLLHSFHTHKRLTPVHITCTQHPPLPPWPHVHLCTPTHTDTQAGHSA